MKVRFLNVGRYKKTWEATISHLGYNTITRQMRNNKALRSQDISWEYSEEQRSGVIYAGGRAVGTFEVLGEGGEG